MQTKVTHSNRGYLFSQAGSRRLKAEMVLSGRAITITADGEARRYPIGMVDIQRYDGNTFEVTLGDHVLFYESDFPLRFTFDFLPAMEAGRTRRSRRDRPASRKRPTPRVSHTRREPEVETPGAFDEPGEQPWTALALGHEQAALMGAVTGRPAHEHTWEAADHEGESVQMCTECRQVLIDLSDAATRHPSDH